MASWPGLVLDITFFPVYNIDLPNDVISSNASYIDNTALYSVTGLLAVNNE